MIRPLIPIADYLVHFDYVVEKLCKNRDKPFLKCYGSCYVSEKLASGNYLNLNDHNSDSNNSKIEIFFPVFLLENQNQWQANRLFLSKLEKPFYQQSLKDFLLIHLEEKPPIV